MSYTSGQDSQIVRINLFQPQGHKKAKLIVINLAETHVALDRGLQLDRTIIHAENHSPSASGATHKTYQAFAPEPPRLTLNPIDCSG